MNTSTIYLIHCENLCKCYCVPPPSTTIITKKKEEESSSNKQRIGLCGCAFVATGE
jgi:hypothetical protein